MSEEQYALENLRLSEREISRFERHGQSRLYLPKKPLSYLLVEDDLPNVSTLYVWNTGSKVVICSEQGFENHLRSTHPKEKYLRFDLTSELQGIFIAQCSTKRWQGIDYFNPKNPQVKDIAIHYEGDSLDDLIDTYKGSQRVDFWKKVKHN